MQSCWLCSLAPVPFYLTCGYIIAQWITSALQSHTYLIRIRDMTCMKRAASTSGGLGAGQPRSSLEEHDILSAPSRPLSAHSAAAASSAQSSSLAIRNALQPDSDTIDSDDTPETTATASPLLSQVGPISPVEELVPAVYLTSSPSRRLFQQSVAPASSSATPTILSFAPGHNSAPLPATALSGQTCRLVLDWSRPRASGAIFHSSSGVHRVRIQARPPHIISQTSIERLKWRESHALSAKSSDSTSSSHSTTATSATAIKQVKFDNLSRTPVPTTIPLPPNPI